MTITSTDVISGIVFGMFDDDLDKIKTAIRTREGAKREFLEFVVGDKVVFNARTRPVYLQGATATVTSIRRTKVTVAPDEDHGRFRAGRPIITSTDLLDKAGI
jgi:hypothetical protein